MDEEFTVRQITVLWGDDLETSKAQINDIRQQYLATRKLDLENVLSNDIIYTKEKIETDRRREAPVYLAVSSLKQGEASEILSTSDGYVFYACISRKTGEPITQEQVLQELKALIVDRRLANLEGNVVYTEAFETINSSMLQ